ncbi:hypothetical protein XANCAGTX0491_006917 [Xanthoria calcicola]
MSSLAQSQDDGVGTCNGNQSEKVLTPRHNNPMSPPRDGGVAGSSQAPRFGSQRHGNAEDRYLGSLHQPAVSQVRIQQVEDAREHNKTPPPKDHDNDAELTTLHTASHSCGPAFLGPVSKYHPSSYQ